MATLDRSEVLVLFASVLIGSAAGWWSRTYWGDGFVPVAATLIGTVIGYCIIAAALRIAGHPVE
jgi:predicted membrane protein